jgi:hypothetical protein
MRSRSRIVFAVLVAVILGALAWFALRPQEHEPVSQGKPLTEWLNDLGSSTNEVSARAEAALRQMGTNAIPGLLKEAAITGNLKAGVIHLLQSQPLVKFHFAPLPDHQARAQRGFNALGRTGMLGVAQGLTNSDRWIRLGCVGQWELCKSYPEILFQPLFNCLKDPEPMVRARACNALGMLGQQPDTVVPALTALLSDPEVNVRGMAALGLSLFNARAKPAVPALLKLLTNSPSGKLEFWVTNALTAIDPAAAAKAGVK